MRASSDTMLPVRMRLRWPVLAAVGAGVLAVTGLGIKLTDWSQAADARYAVAAPQLALTVPNGAVYMSADGNDAAGGTLGSPVKTLARAVALAPDGGTIVLRAGVYADGLEAPIARSLNFQAYPHESVWLDGAVEGGQRARALVFAGGYGASVRGLGFRHYGGCTTAVPAPCAAVASADPNFVATGNVFAETAEPGLAAAAGSGTVMRDNRFWKSTLVTPDAKPGDDPAADIGGNVKLTDPGQGT